MRLNQYFSGYIHSFLHAPTVQLSLFFSTPGCPNIFVLILYTTDRLQCITNKILSLSVKRSINLNLNIFLLQGMSVILPTSLVASLIESSGGKYTSNHLILSLVCLCKEVQIELPWFMLCLCYVIIPVVFV